MMQQVQGANKVELLMCFRLPPYQDSIQDAYISTGVKSIQMPADLLRSSPFDQHLANELHVPIPLPNLKKPVRGFTKVSHTKVSYTRARSAAENMSAEDV
jgi:hypothetical protein